MKKRFTIVLVTVLLTGFLLGGVTYYLLSKSVTPDHTPITPRVPGYVEETARAFSEIVKAVSPAVVNISTTKTFRRHPTPFDEFFDFFYPFPNDRARRWKEQSLGSGVIVSSDGYIITNNHVVERADEIRVTLFDKRTLKAKLIGSDPKTDIAVIKIDGSNLATIPWGDSDKLQVGEFVLAVGNPFGLSHTVTMGIISAVGRADVGIAEYEDFIQTDAAINPGNSGGPLVNINGELIGINTAIFSKTGGYQGIGFAVPSNMARRVMEQLIKEGRVTRGWLGVVIQELTPEMAQKFGLRSTEGVLVSDVTKGSPAHKAGIVRGDIIIEFDNKKVVNVSQLRNMVAQTKVGSVVNIKLLRGNREIDLTVNIMELPAEIGEKIPSSLDDINVPGNPLSGITVSDLTPSIARQLGVGTEEKGVVVIKIEHGSPADEAGIRKGDVIQEIDRQEIRNLNDFNRVISKLGVNDTVLLFINRGGKKFYLTVQGG